MGDALIFHSMAHLLRGCGWEATLFSDHLASFGAWLETTQSKPQPSIEETYASYDAVVLQHDNSPKAFAIEKLPLPLYIFYGVHRESKHRPLRERWDYVCDPTKTMVDNVTLASEQFFGEKATCLGLRDRKKITVTFISLRSLTPPAGLIHRRYPKRIAIHPTASSREKIWPRAKFLALKTALAARGYDPVFVTAPAERGAWDAPLFATLSDLSAFLYESGGFVGNDSGPGHLASCLAIPHLIIGGNGLQMPLWRTGWHPGELLIPPPFLMRFKALRRYWHAFISAKHVINKFIHNTLRN